MLRDERIEIEATWRTDTETGGASYREIDRQLRRIAKGKTALESEEARWLREAEAQQIWRKLGFSTALEYLEDVFDYAPRTALERLRVAKELGQLDDLDAKLRDGEISYAAARELSRVMTPKTQAAWLARAHGKNVHDIQAMVSGHKKGDDPDDPKDETLVEKLITLRLLPHVEALFRQTRANLSDEFGSYLDDNALIEALCRRARDGGSASAPTPDDLTPVPTRAPAPAYQTSVRRCDACKQGFLLSGGNWVPITPAATAVAECDSIVDESSDADTSDSSTPKRTRRSRRIPTKVRDFVWQRDDGRCRFPGCRAIRNCDLHHLEPWARGGKHVPSNIIVLCSGHHKLLHEGLIAITGTAPDQLAFVRDGEPVADTRAPTEIRATNELRATAEADKKQSRFAAVATLTQAKAALRDLGYKARAAKDAIDRAYARVGKNADVATLVQTVLALDRETKAEPPASADANELKTMARQAIVQTGYPASVAQRAIDDAYAALEPKPDLVALIKEALRRCAIS